MRGVYLNSDYDRIAATFGELADYSQHFSESVFGQRVELVYDHLEWPVPPVVKTCDAAWYCYGWFIYAGKRNDFTQLITDFEKDGCACLTQISAGMFVIIKLSAGGSMVVTDPLGLSTHYTDLRGDRLIIAPSVKCFDDKEKNPLMGEILGRQGNLFGNHTVFFDVERLEPGCCIQNGSETSYYQPDFNSPHTLDQIPSLIAELCSHWSREERAVAISGGLDSRLILASSEFAFGYTYGPEHTGDRPIARKFRDDFDVYEEFSYLAPPKIESETAICEVMFAGTSSYAYRLLSAFVYARQLAKGSRVFFDGYLGDVLQRGAFLKSGGLIGELFKLFPFLFYFDWLDDEAVLKRRYKTLTAQQFDFVRDDYRHRTANLRTNDPFVKLTYYEFVYGRGARYVINGGNITAGQVYTVIPVFTDLRIFHTFLSQPMLDSVTYNFIAQVWKSLPKRYKAVATETGFKPGWPAFIIPYVHFYYRLKLRILPGGNYGRQARQAEKRAL